MQNTQKPDRDQLNYRFEINMQAIKYLNHALHEQLLIFKPTLFHLGYDKKNNLNIKQEGGDWLYHENPIELCQQQYNHFITNPKKIGSTVPKDPNYSPSSSQTLNQLHMGMLYEQHYDFIEQERATPCEYISNLIIFGTGMGYHIELFTQQNVRSLDIYEPNIDIFFLSLFIIDYKSIIDIFSEPFKRIQFHIGKTPSEFIQSVFNSTALRKRFILSNTHIYKHYTNRKMENDFKEIINKWHTVYNSNGFIEDEVYGLNHYRLKLDLPIRHITHTRKKTIIPCFILASGPSIDSQIEAIKKLRNKVCIISCSSSISICHKHGITPDFHVEMERGYDMAQYLESFNDAAYLKKITLLALNVVHPKLVPFFKNSIIGLKPNDLASEIAKSYNSDSITSTLR